MKNQSGIILTATIIGAICIVVVIAFIAEYQNVLSNNTIFFSGLIAIITTCTFLIILPVQKAKTYDLGYAKAKREDVIETYMTLPQVSLEDDKRYVTIFDSFYYQDQGAFWGVFSYNDSREDGSLLKITKRVRLRRELDKDYEKQTFQILSGDLFQIKSFS